MTGTVRDKAIILVLSLLGIWVGYGALMEIFRLKGLNDKLQGDLNYVTIINDSTQARWTRTSLENSQLRALRDAAKSTGGKVVAGVRIVTRADTVFVPVTQTPTEVKPDGTRVATVSDTTKGGISVNIHAEAPPYPADLKIGYNVIVPPFTPEVGFVDYGQGRIGAVVSWAGQDFEIEDAYHIPEKKWFLTAGSQVVADREKVYTPTAYLSLGREVKGFYVSGQAGVLPGKWAGITFEKSLLTW